MQAENVSIGTNVNARFKTNGAFYPGKIKKMNTDGTYDITFDDGDERKDIKPQDYAVIKCNSDGTYVRTILHLKYIKDIKCT